MLDGLSFFYEGRDKFIQFSEFIWREGDARAGIVLGLPILFLGVFGRIESFFQCAFSSLRASIAYIGWEVKPAAVFFLISITIFTAALAGTAKLDCAVRGIT